MSVIQLSVFLESRPGHLAEVLREFEHAGLSVRGYCAADTGDYGIVRFILDDPYRAHDLLAERGWASVTSEVICLRLDDVPGELARVAGILADAGVNVDYSYSMIGTYIIIHVSDPASALERLGREPLECISQEQIAALSALRLEGAPTAAPEPAAE